MFKVHNCDSFTWTWQKSKFGQYIYQVFKCFSIDYICALHPTPEGQNILILTQQGQNFKMITSAKHEGYISVWARVRSTRVPNIIHHEGRGCKTYKDKRDRSFKILRYLRSRPGVIICEDKMRYRIKMLSEK